MAATAPAELPKGGKPGFPACDPIGGRLEKSRPHHRRAIQHLPRRGLQGEGDRLVQEDDLSPRKVSGERRPKRLTYGPCHRAPYTFYSARIPGEGLPLQGTLCVVLWLHLYDPMWPYAPLFHFKCSDPKVHPLTKRTHWVEHPHWTLDSMLGRSQLHYDLTQCECGVRVRMELECRHAAVGVCNA